MRSDIIRPYLEKLLGQGLGTSVVSSDPQGRYNVRVGRSGFLVELIDHDPVLVRLWSPAVIEVKKSVKLLETLNSLNGTGFGLRAFLMDGTVILATELVAETLDATELQFACGVMANAAERLGPELVERFGGHTLFPAARPTDDGPVEAAPLIASAGYL